MELIKHETCQQYVARRLFEGWKITKQKGFLVILESPEGIIRPVDLRNDVETLRPNATGDENAITHQVPIDSFPATDHWNKVDEASPDGITTYVYENGDNFLRDLYNVDNHSIGVGIISKITVYACTRVGFWQDQDSVKICIKSGTGAGAPDTLREAAINQTPDNAWHTYPHEWSTNPATDAAWTWDEIDNLQIGIALRTHQLGYVAATYCTQIYVEVDYTAGGETHYGTATLSGAGTLVGIGHGIFIGAGTLTGSGALSAIGGFWQYAKASLSGAGTLSGIGSCLRQAAATLAGTGTLAGKVSLILIGKATLSGVGSLTAKGVAIFVSKATLAGSGTLATIGEVFKCGAATLAGTGNLIVSAVGTFVGKATLLGVGSLTVTGHLIRILKVITTQGSIYRVKLAEGSVYRLKSIAGRIYRIITKEGG